MSPRKVKNAEQQSQEQVGETVRKTFEVLNVFDAVVSEVLCATLFSKTQCQTYPKERKCFKSFTVNKISIFYKLCSRRNFIRSEILIQPCVTIGIANYNIDVSVGLHTRNPTTCSILSVPDFSQFSGLRRYFWLSPYGQQPKTQFLP